MEYCFDEDDLSTARKSLTGKVAENWKIEKITELIHSKQIQSMDMLQDSSLYVTFALVPAGGKYYNMGVQDNFIIEPNAASYKIFLELSGLKEPGQYKSFIEID